MILTSPKSYLDAEKLSQYCDAFMVGIVGFTASQYNIFSREDIKKLSKLNKEIIIRLDNFMFETDIAQYYQIINELSNYKFYITDLGILEIFKELNLLKQVIYDAKTMITNKLDAKTYIDLGIDSVGMSLEIPFNDVIEASSLPLFYQVFGYREMFFSKRKVVSLYQEKSQISRKLDNLSIKEVTRDDIYPVVENEKGVFIYRSYVVSLLSSIKNANLKYAYLESFMIDEQTYLEVVKLFSQVLNDELNINEALLKYQDLNLETMDGFTYQDTVYEKGALYE